MALTDLTDRLAEAARDLGSEDLEQTLEKAIGFAVEVIEGCDAAGITLVYANKRLDTPAATNQGVARGDALQYELGEGPCIDAVWDHELVSSPDLARDKRWPSWGPKVVEELGVRSMLCVQLFTTEGTAGGLNMYSKTVNGFAHDDDRHEALALAAHVAVALAASRQIAGLKSALTSRTVIGQAEGILMERFDISAARAFEVLKRVSSHSNIKLNAVATELVETREMPGQPSPTPPRFS